MIVLFLSGFVSDGGYLDAPIEHHVQDRPPDIKSELPKCQALRDEIGTAMTNKKSRADQFPHIIHDQEGEGEAKEGFLGKEGADVCVTQKMCHIDPPDACCYQVGSSVIQVE